MRSILIALMLLPITVAVGLMLLLYAQLKFFRRAVPALTGPADMRRFKRLAAFQMRAARVGLPLTFLPALVWLYGKFIAGSLGWLDLLLYGILPLAVPFICSGLMIGTARDVRATPVSDPSLGTERDHVAHVWIHENRPDW